MKTQNNHNTSSIEIIPEKEKATVLLFDSARGTYIPQNFAEMVQGGDNRWEGFNEEDIKCLLNGDTTENEWYWEAWQSVCDNARCILDGDIYNLHLSEDGDLWALCFERMTEDEKENFGFCLD